MTLSIFNKYIINDSYFYLYVSITTNNDKIDRNTEIFIFD